MHVFMFRCRKTVVHFTVSLGAGKTTEFSRWNKRTGKEEQYVLVASAVFAQLTT